ncbi:7-deoxyloganetin glucosyltransferase-like isoform X2 [Punica granatum]|uniref:Glycosyltransferase n=1 Tax=Punica granatum TaxID=22663 RepID=A0A6P8CNU3_PUNGR|nr:7-deoxyloganetin glucosyltransferase-like isoform X2 [Punica granatum]
MESVQVISKHKPHAVCIPYPAQGHINPMLNLAKILHLGGFHITFVHSEYNHRRLLKSLGPDSLDGIPDFHFDAIPDGLPQSEDVDSTQDIPSLSDSTSKNCLGPFMELLSKLNDTSTSDVPPVTCIVSDGAMSFTIDAAEKFGVPCAVLWTPSACGFVCYTQYHKLFEKGLAPLKDWIPGMKSIRFQDLPSFIRTTNANDIMVNYIIREVRRTFRASALIFNTFDSLEKDVLKALSSMFPRLYTIGPLQLLKDQMKNIGSKLNNPTSLNLWKEETECLEWLELREPGSVLYVNFGSIAMLTTEQVVEFAWGLANSQRPFLWVVRSDLVYGNSALLPPEFMEETQERGMLAGWVPQDKVLNHPAIGGFLTHCGWNSILESLCGGIPVICWPFFAEQQTNCLYCRTDWGIGLEIDGDVKRDEVEKLVKELMEGEKGSEMRKKAAEWKRMAEEAVSPGGSSYQNLENLLAEVLLKK